MSKAGEPNLGGKTNLTHEQLLDAVAAFKAHGSVRAAAKSMNLARGTFQNHLRWARAKGLLDDGFTPPQLPEGDLPTPKLIDHMCDRYGARSAHHAAKKWMPFTLKTSEPIAINWFGDPHVDDNGCNWPLLREHCGIIRRTPGMYGANIGDTHNNWVGRLMREYANQDTSKETAYKLIEWFFRGSGVKWLIMLLGNHDSFTDDGARLLKSICGNLCPMVDWRAQFKLVFPNKREVLIDAAHDFPGGSQWNPLHGPGKAAVMGGRAHLYVCGHRHNWAMFKNECPETKRVYDLVRTRGYKHIDHYADLNGYPNQKFGSSIVTVIDPLARDDTGLIKCFADTADGAEYLKYLRKRH